MNEISAAGAQVLVVGADGLIGGSLANGLSAAGVRVHRATRRAYDRSDAIMLDLSDPLLDRVVLPEVETAFLCASVNGFANCRADPAGAYAVNVSATELLSRRLIAQGSRVISLSSSAVFDFSRPRRRAHEPVCPTTVYGRIEAAAEQRMLALDSAVTIVRLTKVLTPSAPRFVGWLRALASGLAVAAYSDLYFCPIPLDFAITGLMRIMADTNGGIYQLSGSDDLSYEEALRHLAGKMGLAETRVLSDRAVDHGIPLEEIATFTSLDISRYTTLCGECAPMPLKVLENVFGPAIEQIAAIGAIFQ